MTGGDIVADTLVRHGVRFLFTLCGGHISPILVSAKARGIRVVDTRHEATAVFAADAVARLTGDPGGRRGHRRPRRHEHDHRGQERADGAVAAGAPRRRHRDPAARPRARCRTSTRWRWWRPHVKWASRVTRVRDLVPALEEAFRLAPPRRPRSGLRRVPGGPALSRGARPRVVRGQVRPPASLGDRRPRSGTSAATCDASSLGVGPGRCGGARGRRPRPSRTSLEPSRGDASARGPSARCSSSAARPS